MYLARLVRSDPLSTHERSKVEERLVTENVGRELALGNVVIMNADNAF